MRARELAGSAGSFARRARTAMDTTPEPAVVTRRPRWRRALLWCAMLLVLLAALAVVVPNVLEKYTSSGSDGGQHKCRTELQHMRCALDEYAARNQGRYPAEFADLLAPDSNGYRYLSIARVPRDPWKSEYVYVAPSVSGGKPSVFSRGPDGEPGTDDDIRLDDE